MKLSVQDIKANQQLLKVLELSRSLLDNVFDELPVALIIFDVAGRVLKMNRACLTLFGGDETDILGHGLSDVFSPALSARFFAYLAAYEQDPTHKSSFENESPGKLGNLSILWQLSAVRLGRGAGKVLHVGLGSDMTEAREALERLISIKKDLKVAKALQAMLLPKTTATQGTFFRTCGYYEPASQVGGDWWWQHTASGDKVFGMLCDVSGHGVSAAMVTAVMAGTVETLIQLLAPDQLSIERIFTGLEPAVSKLCGELHWVCAFGLEFCGSDNQLKLASAGMPPCCILRGDGTQENIQIAGDPFGAAPQVLKTRRVAFNPGDRLVAYSDGLYEFLVEENRVFGRPRLIKLFKELARLPLEAFSQELMRTIHSKRQEPENEDDMTFIAIDRL